MQHLWILWIAAIVFFSVLEVSTVNMVSVWFVGGALGAFLASLLGAPMWLQITVFVVVSAVLLACLRPFVKKVAQPKKEPTNFDRILGQTAPVTEKIDNIRGTGAVKVDGKEWSARSADGQPIEQDTLVTIEKVEGVKVIVRR